MDITTHNQSARLNPKDPTYKQWIFRYTFLELEKDLGHAGDITSDALFVKPQEVTARIMSKNKGILAGIQEVEYFLVDSDSAFKPRLGKLEVNFLKDDGAVVAENETVMTMTGDVRDILKVERTLLNLLGRMSGVATLTRSFVERAGKVLVTTASAYQRKVAALRPELPSLRHVLLIDDLGSGAIADTLDLRALLRAAPDTPALVPTGSEDPALLHFTSGTTGLPKGAIHVHGAVLTHFATARTALDLQPEAAPLPGRVEAGVDRPPPQAG